MQVEGWGCQSEGRGSLSVCVTNRGPKPTIMTLQGHKTQSLEALQAVGAHLPVTAGREQLEQGYHISLLGLPSFHANVRRIPH